MKARRYGREMVRRGLAPSYSVRSTIAVHSGEFELGLDLHLQGIDASTCALITGLHGGLWRTLCPEIYNHPLFQEKIKEVGIDKASIAKRNVTDLPF